MITIAISVAHTVSPSIYTLHCAEYLEHLASRIFTLFMPFLLISSIASILCLLILKKILFRSFDFMKNTQNLHIYTNLKKQIRTISGSHMSQEANVQNGQLAV